MEASSGRNQVTVAEPAVLPGLRRMAIAPATYGVAWDVPFRRIEKATQPQFPRHRSAPAPEGRGDSPGKSLRCQVMS